MLREVTISGLTIDPESNTPILILKPVDSEDMIPIWIGLLEATSIATALKKVEFDRPMTHDLFINFMDKLATTILKIEVCDLKDNTFFARIYFSAGEREFDMDARPSDAIAIATRCNAPIYVDDNVIQKFKMDGKEFEAMDKSEEGKKWADYLTKLDPEDFGKYKV